MRQQQFEVEPVVHARQRAAQRVDGLRISATAQILAGDGCRRKLNLQIIDLAIAAVKAAQRVDQFFIVGALLKSAFEMPDRLVGAVHPLIGFAEGKVRGIVVRDDAQHAAKRVAAFVPAAQQHQSAPQKA